MNKSKAGVILVLFSFLFYTLALPVLTAERAWALPIKSGSQGEEVKETQIRLQALGFLNGKVDGIFGPKTAAAVKAFQRKWKLVVDGIVGVITMGSLRKSTPRIVTPSRGNTSPPKKNTQQTNKLPSRPVVLKIVSKTTQQNKPNTTNKPVSKPAVVLIPAGNQNKPPADSQNSKPPVDSQNKPPVDSQNKPPESDQTGSQSQTGGQPDNKPAGDTQSSDKPPVSDPSGSQSPAGGQTDNNGQNPGGNNSDTNTSGGNQDSSQSNPPVSRGDSGAPAGIPTVASGKMVLGFTAEDYIGDKASYNSVVNFGQNVDAIATFTYFVDGNGNLISQTPVPRDTIKMAKSKGVRSLALIHNFQSGGFNKDIARSLMTSATARQSLINQLLVILPKEGYDGINVDIEGIYPADSTAYINLLKELKTALSAKGYWLTVSIPAKTFNNPNDGWSGGYDYNAIGALADHVLLMTYDQNWMGGTPGPIATLPWVDQVMKYAVSQMPSAKILLGLATYGYDWGAPKNRALSYPNAVALAKQYGATINWHQEYQVPYFKYWDAQGNQHEVWFEDQRSAKAKLELVKKYGLAGVGIWRLGFEDSLYWDVLKEYRVN